MEVKKADKAFDLFKTQLYAQGERRRQHEYEADSLAYIYLKKTKYHVSQITATMRLSIKYDSIKPTGLTNKIYYETFNLPNQPFQDKWLKMEDFSQYNYDLYKEKIKA